jgi:hypothetical protein
MKTTLFVKSFDMASRLLEKGYTITAITKDEYKAGRQLIHFKNEDGLQELIDEYKAESARIWQEKQRELGKEV